MSANFDESLDYEPGDYYEDDGYCETCGGSGIVITCFDDLCVGGDHCIHGDGEEACPDCNNWM